jgi:hypothetical protein
MNMWDYRLLLDFRPAATAGMPFLCADQRTQAGASSHVDSATVLFRIRLFRKNAAGEDNHNRKKVMNKPLNCMYEIWI